MLYIRTFFQALITLQISQYTKNKKKLKQVSLFSSVHRNLPHLLKGSHVFSLEKCLLDAAAAV